MPRAAACRPWRWRAAGSAPCSTSSRMYGRSSVCAATQNGVAPSSVSRLRPDVGDIRDSSSRPRFGSAPRAISVRASVRLSSLPTRHKPGIVHAGVRPARIGDLMQRRPPLRLGVRDRPPARGDSPRVRSACSQSPSRARSSRPTCVSLHGRARLQQHLDGIDRARPHSEMQRRGILTVW